MSPDSVHPVKRKKIPYGFLIVTVCILLFLCLIVVAVIILRKPVDYPFLHDASEIRAIEIVHVGEYDPETDVPIQTTLCTVEDIDVFLEKFAQVDCFRKAPPEYIGSDLTAIKIIYNNEEYELIGKNGPGTYTRSQETDTWEFQGLAFYAFDDKQLQKLISEYTQIHQ